MRRNIFVILFLIFLAGAGLFALMPIEKKIQVRMLPSNYRRLNRFVVAMSKVESGNYSSSNYKNLNSIFNIKNANNRNQPGAQLGNSDFRYYSYKMLSLEDLLSWFDYTKFPVRVSDVRQFVQELKARNYFEEPEGFYLEKMNLYVNP